MGKVSPLVKGKTDMGLVNKIIKRKIRKFNHHKMIFILFSMSSWKWYNKLGDKNDLFRLFGNHPCA